MKFTKILLLSFTLVILSACSLKKDNLEDSTIYTTVHPISYLTSYMFKDYGSIKSIYPAGAEIKDYKLTNKQIKKYAKGDLFIYNGLSEEKTIAKNLINENQNILLINFSSGVSYQYDERELWLSPNNYLMLAKNIRYYLKEYLESQIISDYVEEKYQELSEIISIKDAELRRIGKEAKNNGSNTLIVSDNALKFLEGYGFNVISLDEDALSEGTLNSIKNNFNKEVYTTIFVLDDNYNDNINSLVNDYKAKTIDVSSMTNVKENNTDDYLSVMQEFIDNIDTLCLG